MNYHIYSKKAANSHEVTSLFTLKKKNQNVACYNLSRHFKDKHILGYILYHPLHFYQRNIVVGGGRVKGINLCYFIYYIILSYILYIVKR